MKKTLFIILIFITFSIMPNAFADSADGYIVKFSESGGASLFSAQSIGEPIGNDGTLLYVKDSDELEYLESHAEIEYIEPNLKAELFDTPSDPYYSSQTNLTAINAEGAWELGCYGNDITIGVIDSGIYEHPDISANIAGGYNYTSGSTDITDNEGHGTFVSGIIAAQSNNALGIAGIADHAKIIMLKCFDTDYETGTNVIIKAIYDAVDDYGCDVINMSFGIDGNSRALEEAVNYAADKGVILVAAVGNDGTGTLFYPAAYDNVIGVGSVNSSNTVSSFSQQNKSVYVCAPGEDIISLSNSGSSYSKGSGTSFSAPEVSAAAAIAKCVDSSIDSTAFKTVLEDTSIDLGTNGRDNAYGYGLIDIGAITHSIISDTDIFVSPLIISDDTGSFTVYNNTDSSSEASVIIAGYTDNGKMEYIQTYTLPYGMSKRVEYTLEPETLKLFLWKSFSDMIPLAAQATLK